MRDYYSTRDPAREFLPGEYPNTRRVERRCKYVDLLPGYRSDSCLPGDFFEEGAGAHPEKHSQSSLEAIGWSSLTERPHSVASAPTTEHSARACNNTFGALPCAF